MQKFRFRALLTAVLCSIILFLSGCVLSPFILPAAERAAEKNIFNNADHCLTFGELIDLSEAMVCSVCSLYILAKNISTSSDD